MTKLRECKQEIHRLHKFFVDWFAGELPNTEQAFSTGVSCLAPSFHLISPRGVVDGHETLLQSLRKAYGIHKDNGFEIDIRNCQLIHENDSTVAMTYEEWQRTKATETARVSTVIFQVQPEEDESSSLEGLKWLHVHETWLPGKGNS